MDLKTCKLYGIKRKRDLFSLLGIRNIKEIQNIINSYSPYISKKNKRRLIEPVTSEKIKTIQKRIQIILNEIIFDDNVFSGTRGKSYISNGKYHIGNKYVVALDISKFFPNTGRGKIFNFFKNDLCVESDVAKLLTDICTVDLEIIKNIDTEVNTFISENKIKHLKHIPTGSAISCILSYLANYKMFNEISEIAQKQECKCSIYVDDVVVSSQKIINKNLINKIISIINQNGYKIQKSKLRFYQNGEFKRITGNVLAKDGRILVIPNKIRRKMIQTNRNNNIDFITKANKIRGLNQVVHQINIVNNM